MAPKLFLFTPISIVISGLFYFGIAFFKVEAYVIGTPFIVIGSLLALLIVWTIFSVAVNECQEARTLLERNEDENLVELLENEEPGTEGSPEIEILLDDMQGGYLRL